MAHITGNLVDWRGNPRPGLSPEIVFTPRATAGQGPNLFFPVPETITPAADGSFDLDLIASPDTTPNGLYDVEIRWLNGEGVPVGFEQVTDANHPLVVPAEGGDIGDILQLPPTSLQVWVGETDNPAYGFWYQPSTALLRS